jgi:hypothetical protein
VEEQRGAFPVDRLCRVMNVSPRGLRAFRSRPASRRQRTDMVVLAHIKGNRCLFPTLRQPALIMPFALSK